MKFINRTDEKNKHGNYLYLFECPVCSKVKKMPLSNGKRDKTCGCTVTPRNTITSKNRKLYECWVNMRTRCLNPKYAKAHRYSERGILLCEEWKKFLPFQKWALSNGYTKGLQIDRKDNDKGHTPENCRWVTNSENHRNSSNVKLTVESAEEIRREREKGVSEIALSIRFSVCRRQINNIVKKRHWM